MFFVQPEAARRRLRPPWRQLSRLEAYERSTEPLIQFYRNLDRLTVILASGSPEEIFARTVTALGEPRKQGKTRPEYNLSGLTVRIDCSDSPDLLEARRCG